ncbi:Do family serine endopeptidase [Allorhizobium terrae]|uniref:Probable periplasmic serine endoprotease DegP-like n=1 Tax=Allorhizobium terrae TaxID=1848972 RepID=A0A4S4A2R9_9HYPH|nr:Do family serine endopeptidase [Allorhizobium terrae]THF52540.1 Do family serine endopeptidase [Allorhizobium terrae]
MSDTKKPNTTKTILRTGTIAGLAALLMAGTVPAMLTPAHAEAVNVQAPQVPSFADLVSAVSPAVVSIRVKSDVQQASDDGSSFSFNGRDLDQLPDPLKRFFKEWGMPGQGGRGGPDRHPHAERHGKLRPVAQGSGFFISEDGYLVTNNHVVSDGQAYTVVMNDGTEYDAKLVGKDQRTDLAVLKVDAPKKKFTYVNWADDSKVRVGDWVVAVGNPFGLGGTVTSGIVSAFGRDIGSGPYDDYIQIDAPVNRGNSGGPDFNLNGQVVGINTAIFSPSGGSVGIAFAIPASTAKSVVNELIKHGEVKRGWLGVQIQPVSKDIAESLGLADAKGALVAEPQAGSPGEKAGIKQGDVITAVNGDPVKDPRDLAKRIAGFAPGTQVDVSLWRDGASKSVKVDLGNLPAAKDMASNDSDQSQSDNAGPATEKALANLGITVKPSEDGKGLEITNVDQNSDAADKGLKVGQTITSVNNQDVAKADDVTKIIDQAKKSGRTRALFQIQTDNGSRFVALPISQG